MNDYASNSNKSKEEVSEKPKHERFSPMTTGRKKTQSTLQKFASIFIAEDVDSVRGYIYEEVIKPAAKRIVSDMVDAILYGGGGPRRRRKDSDQTKVSYRKYYDEPDDRYYDDRRDRQRRDQKYSVLDYDEIVVPSRKEAEAILSRLKETIGRYGITSVLDLYDLSNVKCDHTAEKYGWTDLSSAEIVKVRDGSGIGYSFKLPKALPID